MLMAGRNKCWQFSVPGEKILSHIHTTQHTRNGVLLAGEHSEIDGTSIA